MQKETIILGDITKTIPKFNDENTELDDIAHCDCARNNYETILKQQKQIDDLTAALNALAEKVK